MTIDITAYFMSNRTCRTLINIGLDILFFIMETKEAAFLSALVIFVCFTVSVRADAEDDIAYQSGGGDATEFGQAKAVRCVSHMI